MNVRRYTARDMSDAMRQIRDQLGADAVILSSRRVEGMLEVVASGAPNASASRALPSAQSSLRGMSNSVDPDLAAMRRELCDLRALLMQQQKLSERDQWAAHHPLASDCIDRLQTCGFSDKLARSLAGGVQEDSTPELVWSRLRTRISASIATAAPTVLEQGGMLALVGSTGVGKTTTICRLALRQIRRMGRDSVMLVTLDSQRIGAYKQLQAFGQMAGVPVMHLESERDLIALSSRVTDGKLILIDTEGQAARAAADRKLFAQVRDQIVLDTWLVIAATHQGMVLRQILNAFQASDPSALVLTKVDEAEQLGDTLSILLEQRLGLAFYSDGQRIDDDFHKADTQYLTRLALQEAPGAAHLPVVPERRATSIEQPPSAPLHAIPHAQPESLILESVMPFRKTLHAPH